MRASRIFRKSGAFLAGLGALGLAGCANMQSGPQVYGWQSDTGSAVAEAPIASAYNAPAVSSGYTYPPYSGEASHPNEAPE